MDKCYTIAWASQYDTKWNISSMFTQDLQLAELKLQVASKEHPSLLHVIVTFELPSLKEVQEKKKLTIEEAEMKVSNLS